MYGAICDHCKKEWYDDCNGWIAMSDENTMKSTLSEEGWYCEDEVEKEGKNGGQYCNECWHYDDDDNFVLKQNRKDIYK